MESVRCQLGGYPLAQLNGSSHRALEEISRSSVDAYAYLGGVTVLGLGLAV